MRTFVVPCRYDPIVFECVNAIREHHPTDRIVVVDSCSPDPTYLNDLREQGCEILTGNTGYHPGAYKLALEAFDSDTWAFIHDSLIVQRNLDGRLHDFTAVRWFDGYIPADQLDFAWGHLKHMQAKTLLAVPWRGVFGTMHFCSDDIAREIEKDGFYSFPCTTKVEASATERTLGVLMGDSFDTLQGHQTDLHAAYDETFVRKVMKDRP